MLGINREGSPFQVEQYFSPNKSLIGQLLGESDNATTDLLLRRLCQFNTLNVVQDAWPGLSRYLGDEELAYLAQSQLVANTAVDYDPALRLKQHGAEVKCGVSVQTGDDSVHHPFAGTEDGRACLLLQGQSKVLAHEGRWERQRPLGPRRRHKLYKERRPLCRRTGIVVNLSTVFFHFPRALGIQTEWCVSVRDNRSCPYGDNCQFAHSQEELREPERHPKYKTVTCRTYAAGKQCKYKERCRFKHGDHDVMPASRCLQWSSQWLTPALEQAASLNAGRFSPFSQVSHLPYLGSSGGSADLHLLPDSPLTENTSLTESLLGLGSEGTHNFCDLEPDSGAQSQALSADDPVVFICPRRDAYALPRHASSPGQPA